MKTIKATPPRPKNFRLFLQTELVRRCERNPNYSLRSFAKALGISSSALSSILNGKRPLTEKTTIRLGTALGLGAGEIKEFREAESFRKADGEESTQQLALDTFACISEWYHFAILELIRTKSFKPEAGAIARAFGLTVGEVNIAVERLKRLGLLEITPEGKWIDRSTDGKLTTIQGDLTSAAAKLLQQKNLEMGIRALHEVPIEFRSHTTMTMAVHPRDLPEAKKKIQKFRRGLADYFEKRATHEHVYHLCVALYPLTRLETH